jgi:hypothetical protein
VKMRSSAHSGDLRAYEIGSHGVQLVHHRRNAQTVDGLSTVGASGEPFALEAAVRADGYNGVAAS